MITDFALYAEGTTDQRFLIPVITHLVQDMGINIAIEAKLISLPATLGVADAILEAARKAAPYDFLVIHKDTDKRSWQATYDQLIQPGLEKIRQTQQIEPKIALCQHIVALLPQHTIEAWVIADQVTLIDMLETSKNADELGLPKLKEVERKANPKEILRAALRISMEDRPQRQRKQANFSEMLGRLYASIGEDVRLEVLRQLDSFQRFEADLTVTLQELGFL